LERRLGATGIFIARIRQSLDAVSVSDDGRVLATWSGKSLQVFDLRSASRLPFSFLHTRDITNALFSPPVMTW